MEFFHQIDLFHVSLLDVGKNRYRKGADTEEKHIQALKKNSSADQVIPCLKEFSIQDLALSKVFSLPMLLVKWWPKVRF
jgi:hypothetical protein